jgi:GMP synthase-like glutamine amidotransferase
VLRDRGARIHRVELDEGEPLPEWQEFDAIVAMGGPMGAYDDEAHPWLAGEKRSIGEAVLAGRPFWGVCLGVRLLAASLGATVRPGPSPEVGIMPVRLTAEAMDDPVFAGLPRDLLTLQWHGDTFELPERAVLLASSPAYRNQAFRVGDRAYGVQFHLELSSDLAHEWASVPAYAEALDRVLGPGSLPQLIAELDAHADEMRDHGRRMFERWLALAAP